MPQNPNPYKFDGPLHLEDEEDKLVCIPRTKIVDKIILEIKRGAYWAIMGPRQIGKTTLLHLVQNKYPDPYYIYFDFGISPPGKEDFYRWLTDQFLSQLPSKLKKPPTGNDKNLIPELRFMDFLEKFKSPENKKIIFLFDEIDGLPHLSDFLRVWRKIYTEKHYKEGLKKYSVIITGSIDLIAQTIGPNSPFNIAKKYNIEDFSKEESRQLIETPFKPEQLDITIEDEAKDHLISQTSGHPQLLQHLCHILVEKQKKNIKKDDVEDSITELFKVNSTLDILNQNIKTNTELADLVSQLLEKNPIKYLPYKQFSFFGVGAIKADDKNFCVIRNEIYKRYLAELPKRKKEKEKTGKVELSPEEASSEKTGIIAKIFTALAITTGFISSMINYSPGIIAAAILALVAILFFIFTRNK